MACLKPTSWMAVLVGENKIIAMPSVPSLHKHIQFRFDDVVRVTVVILVLYQTLVIRHSKTVLQTVLQTLDQLPCDESLNLRTRIPWQIMHMEQDGLIWRHGTECLLLPALSTLNVDNCHTINLSSPYKRGNKALLRVAPKLYGWHLFSTLNAAIRDLNLPVLLQ